MKKDWGWFDALLFRVSGVADSIKGTKHIIERQAEMREVSFAQSGWDLMDTVDTKSSALLAHVSLITALVGVLLGTFANGPVELTFVTAELVLFLLLGAACLRCLRLGQTDTDSQDSDRFNEGMIDEIAFRWALYRFCHSASIILTLIFAVGLVAHVLWGGIATTP